MGIEKEVDRDGEDGMSGSDLQQSQSGGGSGEYGNREPQQGSGQQGGGLSSSDDQQAGGSSGTGGYGNDQNSQNLDQQADQSGLGGGAQQADYGSGGQSRGEKFDEEQGGGRGGDG